MYRRKFRSRTAKGTRKKTILLALLIFLALSVQTFVFIETHLREPLMNVAKVRVKQIVTEAINSAISEQIARGVDMNKLIEWKNGQNGKINGFMLNYAEHLKITSEAVNVVQSTLKRLQRFPERIPIGQAMDSAIIATLGPDIAIKLVPAGAVKVDLNTRQQNAGINMILVEVFIRITAEVAIIIPFDTQPEVVETELPISYVLVVGDVPTYYFDNKGNPTGNSTVLPPSLSLPMPGGNAGKSAKP